MRKDKLLLLLVLPEEVIVERRRRPPLPLPQKELVPEMEVEEEERDEGIKEIEK